MHIDPNLYQGRPADCTGRLDREIACYDLLDALGISYTRADHDAADTIADCHAIEGLLGAAICLAAALILLLVYFAVYQLVTPEACLTPGQWEKLWRVIP